MIGSSFSVSAEIYEQTAKYQPTLLQYVGTVRIVNEVLEYRQTNDTVQFLNRIKRRNDLLLITKYEEKRGLSADVLGLKSYLMPAEVSSLRLYFSEVYNSNLAKILYTGEEI